MASAIMDSAIMDSAIMDSAIMYSAGSDKGYLESPSSSPEAVDNDSSDGFAVESGDKLAEEDEETSDDDTDSIEYIDEKYRDSYREYKAQLKKNEGYDFDKVYFLPLFGVIVPLDLNDTSDDSFVRLCTGVNFTIRDHNSNKNPKYHLKLRGLLRATQRGFSTFFATFVATSESGGDKIYQCQVWVDFRDEENSLLLELREKPEGLMPYVNDWKKILGN